jgi:hypothetical protein
MMQIVNGVIHPTQIALFHAVLQRETRRMYYKKDFLITKAIFLNVGSLCRKIGKMTLREGTLFLFLNKYVKK